jgi:hypothetical protein
MSVLGWFGTDIRQYVVAHVLDTEFKSVETLSPQELQQISDAVSKALQGKVAEHEVQQVYRELSVDPAIKGVGATRHPGRKPDKIVPRSEFPRHAPREDETILEKRVREEIEDVTLISPVLLPGERRWRFSFHEAEFGAPIKDESFLRAVLRGQFPILMQTGIKMEVLLQTKEDKEDGVWVVKERNVLKVLSVSATPRQETLNLPESPDQQNRGNKKD